MRIAANVIDAIGHTPLIELQAASKATGCRTPFCCTAHPAGAAWPWRWPLRSTCFAPTAGPMTHAANAPIAAGLRE